MIDFESHLTTLLDDVAASVHPHVDADSVFVPTVATMPRQAHRFRPGSFAAVAAAGVVLLGSSAYAMARLTSDSPNSVTPGATIVPETTDGPTTSLVEPTSTIEPPVVEEVVTTLAKVPETKPASLPALVEPSITSTVPTTEPMLPHVEPTVPATEPTVPHAEPTVPATEPTVPHAEPTVPHTEPTVPHTEPTVPPPAPPVVIEFRAKLGAAGLSNNPMQQGFYGTAQPGSAIRVVSQYGVAETAANGDGNWETTLTMLDVPPGTLVAVRITSNTSDRVREFSLLRPAPAPPVVIEFTANLGADGQANTPMTQGFNGTAQPGSAIRIASDWGVAETTAAPNGNWEATLVMPEVPAGTTVAVRITSNTSDRVREFTLHRPGEAVPTFVAFTATAALLTTDHTPPVNEYSGTSTAGAVISITSDYGSTQVVSNGDGKWSARVEFPDAPLNVAFNVHLTSSKGESAYDFPLTRVAPG
jgi:hypothetical protein